LTASCGGESASVLPFSRGAMAEWHQLPKPARLGFPLREMVVVNRTSWSPALLMIGRALYFRRLHENTFRS